MKVLDLFSGIGGFSLGLERAGMTTVAFCEIDPFCRRVLARHWPDVPCFEDVTKLRGSDVRAIDVICGGFPCQDISHAGKGAGIDGTRSGLWKEYARIIGEVRPRYVIVENVAALLGRGLGRVLGDLSALGYDAEWHCISAADVGAPHERERIWIIAYTHGARFQERLVFTGVPGEARCNDDGQDASLGSWWAVEPDLVRVAHGVPQRVDRLRALGNAVVPQIPEIIGRAILEAEGR